jgi:hypothetical protein
MLVDNEILINLGRPRLEIVDHPGALVGRRKVKQQSIRKAEFESSVPPLLISADLSPATINIGSQYNSGIPLLLGAPD